MVKSSVDQDLRHRNFGARKGNYERNGVVKNPGTKQRVQRILGDCWQWESNGQCSRGDNCRFRHDINKHAKMTQPNPSPNSFMQQDERKSSRTRSPRGRSPSGRMSRWPCKDYLIGTCTNSFCKKMAPSRVLVSSAKNVLKLKEQERATFFSPSENRCLLAATLKLEEREFVVDSSASMHMISKKD